jgi:hypothetical protein
MENKTKADPKTVKGKAKTELLVAFLVVLAGHPRRGKKEEKKLSQIHKFTGSACGGA